MVFHRRLLRRARRGIRRVVRGGRRGTRRFLRIRRRVIRRVRPFLLPAAIGLLTVAPIPGSRVAAAGLATRAGLGLLGRTAIRRFGRRALRRLRGRGARRLARRAARAVGRAGRSAGRGFLRFTGLAPFVPLRAGIATIAAGAIVASPKLRGSIARTPKTLFGFGTDIGGRIEGIDPSEQQGFAGTPAGLLIGAGLAGLGAGLIGGAVIPKLLARGEKIAEPFGVLPSPAGLTPISQPLGAVQPEPKEEEPKAMEAFTMPSIKITNKPQTNINIKLSKTRRFINQQVLIRK